MTNHTIDLQQYFYTAVNCYMACIKPGCHLNAYNACRALHTKNYTLKIKSMQETEENCASEKQKYVNACDVCHTSSPYMAKRKNRIDPIFHATNATQAL